MMTTLGLQYLNYKEQQRSNLIKEAETMRSNLANEDRQNRALTETIRANQESESIKWGQLKEDVKHNRATESLSARDIAEKERADKVKEAQSWVSLSEQERSHKAEEALKKEQNLETAKHNRNEEQIKQIQLDINRNDLSEMVRHNMETESFNRDKLSSDAWFTYSKQLGQLSSQSTLPWMKIAYQLASTGASTTAVQSVTNGSVIDQAIGTVKQELIGALSPDLDSDERAKFEQSIDNIDNNVRGYTAKVVGGLADALEYLTTGVKEGDPAGNLIELIGAAFDVASASLSGSAGNSEAISRLIGQYFEKIKTNMQSGVGDILSKASKYAKIGGQAVGDAIDAGQKIVWDKVKKYITSFIK